MTRKRHTVEKIVAKLQQAGRGHRRHGWRSKIGPAIHLTLLSSSTFIFSAICQAYAPLITPAG